MCQLAGDPHSKSWEKSGTMSQKYEEFYNVMPQEGDLLQDILQTPQQAVRIRDALVTEMAIDMPDNWVPPHLR